MELQILLVVIFCTGCISSKEAAHPDGHPELLITDPPGRVATCPSDLGWTEFGEFCYFTEVYTPQNWQEANRLCPQVHPNLQLASVNSQEEEDYLVTLTQGIDNFYDYDYWIGLHRSPRDEVWRWVDGSDFSYENWSDGEPNGDSATQGCVEFLYRFNSGQWNDHDCNEYQYYICKMPKIQEGTTTAGVGTTPAPGTCPAGWEEYERSCYLFKPDLQYDALKSQAHCQTEGGPDANLASIDSVNENEHIYSRMKELSHLPVDPHGYWIGYQKEGLDGDWYWLDGCVTGYENWADGEPNDSDGKSTSVEVWWPSGLWNDHFPDRPQGLVCELHLTPCFDGNAVWRLDGAGDEWYISQLSEEFELTWHQARNWCMQNGGDIASIKSTEEHQWITSWMNEQQINEINMWHGLNSLAVKNNEDYTWADGSTTGYTLWAEGYPARDNNGHYCAFQPAKSTDRWFNAHCDDNNGFVCRRRVGSTDPVTPPTTPIYGGYCPPGYFGIGTTGNKCYKIVYGGDNGVGWTWYDAMVQCRSAVGGFRPDLASIVDQFQMSMIMTQLKNKTFGFWIGGNRGAEYNPWKWVNNDPWEYENWDFNYPDQVNTHHCTELKVVDIGAPGKWRNVNCDTIKGYICEIHKDGNQLDPPPAEVTCEPGFTPYWYQCLSLDKNTRTFMQASDECESQRSYLPSIHSDAENAAIHIMVQKTGNPLWIGLKNWEDSGDYKWLDHWQLVYTNWGDGEPSDPDGLGGCVSMHDDGKWYDDPCDNVYSVPCKFTEVDPNTTPAPLEGECPPTTNGIDWIEYGSHCYLFDTITYNYGWTRAQEQCRAWHPAANLVSIHDHLENEFVIKQFEAAGSNLGSWIGYHRSRDGQEWKWVDGSMSTFQKFGQGEPNGLAEADTGCVEIYPTGGFAGLWNDHTCSEHRHFACKMPKLPAVTTPPHEGGDCAEGWESYGSNCYWFRPDDHLTWDTAQQSCQAAQSGANLASIHSGPENSWVVKRMEEATHYPSLYNFWIGMKLDTGAGTFYWMDGSNDVYYNWADAEPNSQNSKEDCVEVSMEIGDKGAWNDISGTYGFGYVCKYSKAIEAAGESDSGGVSGGTVAGIVIGVLVGVLVLAAVVFLGLSYMGVVSGPIAARQSSSSSSGGGGGGGGTKAFSSEFGFNNNLYENPDDIKTDVSGESVAYSADTEA